MVAKDMKIKQDTTNDSTFVRLIKSKLVLSKCILAALLAIMLILGSVLYYIAAKSDEGNGVISKVFTENKKDITKFMLINDTIKLGLAKGLLAISLISIVLAFTLLGLGSHKKFIVAVTVQIISIIVLIILIVLVILVASNLKTVSDSVTWKP